MTTQQNYWSLKQQQLTLFCHVQPGARQSRLLGLHDQRLKIQFKSQAVDGKANRALIKFLAGLLNIRQTDIVIKSGHKQRKKTLIIQGIEKLPEIIHLP